MNNIIAFFKALISEEVQLQQTAAAKGFPEERNVRPAASHASLLWRFVALCRENPRFETLAFRREILPSALEGRVTEDAILSWGAQTRTHLWRNLIALLTHDQSDEIAPIRTELERSLEKLLATTATAEERPASSNVSRSTYGTSTSEPEPSTIAHATPPSRSDDEVYRIPVILNDPRVDSAVRALEIQVAALSGMVNASAEIRQFHYDQMRSLADRVISLERQLHVIGNVQSLTDRLKRIELEFEGIASARQSFEEFVKRATQGIKNDRVPLTSLLDWQAKITGEVEELKGTVSSVVSTQAASETARCKRATGEEEGQRANAAIEERLRGLELSQQQMRAAIDALQTPGIVSLDADATQLVQYFPVRIFLSENDDDLIERVSATVRKLHQESGFDVASAFVAENGSWFGGWLARSKDAISQFEVEARLKKIERALELKYMEKEQATIDHEKSAAVVTLIKALKDIPQAAVQIGSILIVKPTSSQVLIRSLSQRELIRLEENPRLLKDPATVLDALSASLSPVAPKPATLKLVSEAADSASVQEHQKARKGKQ